MLKLYHANQSRSVRPRWLLEEIGAPYELVRIDLMKGDQKRPEYLALNPNGTVPTLVDDDLVLFESAAICQYLTDKFPDKRLAPPLGTPARGLYYQWIHYTMSELEPPAVAIFVHTVSKPEPERNPAIVTESRQQLAGTLRIVDRALARSPYILGADFSTADVMLGSTIWWAQMMGMIGGDLPASAAYLARLAARPAFQRAGKD